VVAYLRSEDVNTVFSFVTLTATNKRIHSKPECSFVMKMWWTFFELRTGV